MDQKSEKHETKLTQEIEKRLQEMERPDYVFPKIFGKRDYGVVALVAVICLVLLIMGAFL